MKSIFREVTSNRADVRARVTFVVPSINPKQSLRLYVDGLFFRSIRENSEYGMYYVALGEVVLAFARPEDCALIIRPDSYCHLFSIHVDDIQDYYNRVRAAGLVQIVDLLDDHGGFWRFRVIDNNGYNIGVAQNDRVA